jgi:UDP-N-acetylmuramyl pentapeptide phosphotransferase/UDP-N-acetylglucosamine-1-phosphate transferase
MTAISEMTGADIFFNACVVILTLTAGLVYRHIWRRLRGPEVTPSGFGVLLSFVLLATAAIAGVSFELHASLVIVVFASIVYWLDDVIELSAWLRILISFTAGVVIAIAFVIWNGDFTLLLALGICLVVGIINVVLTNIVNFYDGADLNLAMFIMLTAGLVLAFTPAQSDWVPIALACLAFVIPFAIMNCSPNTIYLGDSGSFVFASLLTLMGVSFFKDMHSISPEVAIPVALPAFDVFFVLVKRIREKHDLLTRNYLHLYQRLNRRYKSFVYLLPQLVNTVLCLALATALQAEGFGKCISTIVAMTLVTIPFYFMCRWFFLDGRAGGESTTGSQP